MRWEVKNLGEVCDIIGGGTPSKKVEKYYGGTIPWATVGDLNVEILEKTDLYITQEGLNNSSAKIIPSENVIIATRVGLGKSCILNQDTAINQDLKGLVPKHPGDVSPKFLFRWTQMKAADIIKAGTGATVQGVKMAFVTGLRLPVPPMEEQERIVEILDQAFEAIDKAKANLERNLANARELFQSRLNEIFSNPSADWEVKPLGEVCEIKSGGTPSKSKPHLWSGDIPWISSKDMKSDVLKETKDTVSEDAIGKGTRQVKSGTILVVVRSGILARTIPISLTGVDATFNQDIKALIVSPPLTSEFLFWLLKSLETHLLSSVTRSATVHRLETTILSDINVPIPTQQEQATIVETISSINEFYKTLESKYQSQLNNLEELRQSILEQAFEGKLTEPVNA